MVIDLWAYKISFIFYFDLSVRGLFFAVVQIDLNEFSFLISAYPGPLSD